MSWIQELECDIQVSVEFFIMDSKDEVEKMAKLLTEIRNSPFMRLVKTEDSRDVAGGPIKIITWENEQPIEDNNNKGI